MKLVNVRNNAWNGVWNGAWSVWYGARANTNNSGTRDAHDFINAFRELFN